MMNRLPTRGVSLILSAAMVFTLCPQTQLFSVNATESDDTPYVISEGRPAYSSSQSGDGSGPENAVDGDTTTRWQAAQNDKDEWFYVDLGKKTDIDHIYIQWEAAYAKRYEIQLSDDEENWTTVYEKGTKPGAFVNMAVSYEIKYDDNNKCFYAAANWTSVDNAVYRVTENDEIASAPDNYKFTGHGVAGGQIKLDEGKHTIKVTALSKDDGKELGSGTCEIDVSIGNKGNNGVEVDSSANLKQTINKEDMSATSARYVKMLCTERATNYGVSMFEFQVYGTDGVVKRPVNYGENIALNKETKSSGLKDEWWMYDKEGNLLQKELDKVVGKNAVDGDMNTSFSSKNDINQWLSVDLGDSYDIGRISVTWTGDAGKVYDYQVSNDDKNWTSIYRNVKGTPNSTDNRQVYAQNVRYVRVLAYSKVEKGSGIGISELGVYKYKEGDEKPAINLPELPKTTTKTAGKATYISNDMYLEQAKVPYYKTENVKAPIESNDWWQSMLIKKFGNTICTMPFKVRFSTKGLSVLTATDGWLQDHAATAVNLSVISETTPDFYILPENLDTDTACDKVAGYSDFSVTAQLADDNHVAMTSTFVKGSPYIYNEFGDTEAFTISSSSITSIFDGNGKEILASGSVTTDHIGLEITDDDNKDKTKTSKSYYCLSVPEGTVFKKVGNNIKVEFANKNSYMSVGTMTSKDQIEKFYKHGYAFVDKTSVTYNYDDDNAKITSDYKVTTKVKRTGFNDTTFMCMMPHQWKYSSKNGSEFATYPSVRGDMKAIESNEFTTVSDFSGLIAIFAKPNGEKDADGTATFDTDAVARYLKDLENSTKNITPAADAYWEGKNLHPLAMGVIMADQIGNIELKEIFLQRLKARLVDWFTYDGKNDISYFVYNEAWGTIYYKESEFGANAAICDHHFTYGYFVFSATVLATYDKEFYNDYKDMIEILIRDYANPTADSEYCRFRDYDLYEGHSWAGGYADNDSGNNQESASESLFSWIGMYLWGVLTEQNSYRDAGIFGFTNEMETVKQYWFDYDRKTDTDGNVTNSNWVSDYPYQVVAQVYGAINFYGTFFGGQPLYCYGIHWLPISEYLTYYGTNHTRCAQIYQGLLDDTDKAIEYAVIDAKAEGKSEEEIEKIKNDYTRADTGWQHITWPYLALTNPTLAIDKFLKNDTKVQKTDTALTYWYINALKEIGVRSSDYKITGIGIAGTVYYKDSEKKYTAEVYNPTGERKTASVRDNKGKEVGTVEVGANSLISFEIKGKGFSYKQMSAPTIKATSLASKDVTENISGTKEFDDTQLVELECADEDATIYYTTDGKAPTNESTKYTKGDKILVSSDTTLKAVAVKDGCIDSSYSTATFKIKGEAIQDDTNVALNKTVTASSEDGGNTAANSVDGKEDTRWQAKADDTNEWIQVDLGRVRVVNTVKAKWEAAYAATYEVQTSVDGKTWNIVATENGGTGYITTTFAATNARYVKIQTTSRATNYGCSIYEFEVYGARQTNKPTLSIESGTYDDAQQVTMKTDVKGAEIKYTLDGSEPTEDSETYIEPITISESSYVKAVTYRKGMTLSDAAEAEVIIKGTLGINKKEASIPRDGQLQLNGLSDEKITWESSDSKIATVDKDGLVKGVSVGSAEIIASIPNGKTKTCKVTVVEPIPITKITLSETEVTLKKKEQVSLEAEIEPENTTDSKALTWTSENDNIASVDNKGKVTANSVGTTKITAKAGKVFAECTITVREVTTEEMLVDENFNLALHKNVEVSSLYTKEGSQTTDILTNGVLTDNISYETDWDKTRTYEYVLVDLGKNYTIEALNKVAIKFSAENTAAENMSVQFSNNGVDYVTAYENTALKYSDSKEGLFTFDTNVNTSEMSSVRYVKFYMKGHKDWGFQMKEVAVFSTEQNAKEVEFGTCTPPADFAVTTQDFSQITYTITPAEGQEDYTYAIWIDGVRMGEPVKAGTYTLDGITDGEHVVEVHSYCKFKDNDYIASKEGISRTISIDDGTLYKRLNTKRNIAKGCSISLDSVYSGEGSQDTSVLTDGEISQALDKVVESVWGEKTAVINLDLGKDYKKDQIDGVLLAFKNGDTYGKKYTVEFSEDGKNFEQVATIENSEFKNYFENKLDMSLYSHSKVRYVRFNLLEGATGWGYQISEVAVFDKGFYKVTIDGNVKKVKNGETITLPDVNSEGTNKLGYYDVENDETAAPGATYLVTKDAKFETINMTVNLLNGASMRFSEPSGLRFQAKVTTDNDGLLEQNADGIGKLVTTGTLISTRDLYNDNGEKLELDSKYTKINIVNTGWYDANKNKDYTDDVGNYCGSIVKIAKSNYKREFIAKAYATINYTYYNSDNGNSSVTVYSTTTDKNGNEIDVVGRTINYVAAAIKNSITYYNSLPENARKYVDMYLDVSEENTSEE